MSTRREFLEGCAAAAAGLATFQLVTDSASARVGHGRHELQRVIFDRDFAEARSFASAVRALGIRAQAISGDVTSLWYDDLFFQWRAGAVVMAGLTGCSSLFCLEQLAWDAGHRVVLRVNHTPTANGTVEHTFHGSTALMAAAEQLIAQGSDWSASMARLVAQCPGRIRSHTSRILIETPASSSPWSEPLASWLIAPRSLA